MPAADRLSAWRSWPALLAALSFSGLLGLLLWASPAGRYLENQAGLEWLFKLRGPRPPPTDVLVIPINGESAEALGQPTVERIDKWDRTLFADLIDRLNAAGAAAIAFDIAFLDSGPDADADRRLSQAIRNAGKVILLEWLDQRRAKGRSDATPAMNLDNLTAPLDMLAEASAALAPWPLFKDARTHRFPTFPLLAGRLAPTLPVAALHLQQHHGLDALRRCLSSQKTSDDGDTHPAITDMQHLRLAARKGTNTCADPTTLPLAGVYGGDIERLFNYYGKAGSLTGPAIHHWLGNEPFSAPAEVAGKAVFIGVAEYTAVQQPDTFYTVFRSDRGNMDISGVELAATAFTNLLYDETIRPSPPIVGLLLLLGFGVLAGWLGYWLPGGWAVLSVLALAGLYGGAVYIGFSREQLWLPLAIPLLIQTPAAIAFGWRLRLIQARYMKEAYKGAVAHYVPPHIAERIEQVGHIGTEPEPAFGICMHSDIAGYTRLAEAFADRPTVLKSLENEYWSLIGEQIERHGGQMLEIAGDGMTCIWAGRQPGADLQRRACRAAVDMLRAVEVFNHRHPDTLFPTRIGMHAGQVALGNVGGGGHYTWAVGGDVANTAARLENDLNKLMGTRIIVSRPSLDALNEVLPDLAVRRLGKFKLRGKTRAVEALELIDLESAKPELAAFHAALDLLDNQAWPAAIDAFERLATNADDAGPANFYGRYANACAKGALVPDSHGVIDMNRLSGL